MSDGIRRIIREELELMDLKKERKTIQRKYWEAVASETPNDLTHIRSSLESIDKEIKYKDKL